MLVCGCRFPAVGFLKYYYMFLLPSGACTGLCHPLKNLPQSFEPSLMFFYPKSKSNACPSFFLFLWIFFLKSQYPLASQMARIQASTIMKNSALNSHSLSNYYLFLSKFDIVLLENSYFFNFFWTNFQKSYLRLLVWLFLLSPQKSWYAGLCVTISHPSLHIWVIPQIFTCQV